MLLFYVTTMKEQIEQDEREEMKGGIGDMNSNNKSIGFRLEGDIASDGGEITFYEVDENLPYGEQVLSFSYVRERKRIFRKPRYRAEIDVRHRDEILGQRKELPERQQRYEAYEDVFDHLRESVSLLDPNGEKIVEVVDPSGKLEDMMLGYPKIDFNMKCRFSQNSQ